MDDAATLIKNIRAKYPGYSDLSDSDLSAKIHAKYPDAYPELATSAAPAMKYVGPKSIDLTNRFDQMAQDRTIDIRDRFKDAPPSKTPKERAESLIKRYPGKKRSFLDPITPKGPDGEPLPNAVQAIAPDFYRRATEQESGAGRALAKTVLGMADPTNAMMLAAAPFAGAAGIAIPALLGAQQIPQSAEAISSALKEKDPEAAIEAVTSGALGTAMAAAPLIHGAKSISRGKPNVQERSPATILQREPGQGGGAGSGGRVQPGVGGETPAGAGVAEGGAQGPGVADTAAQKGSGDTLQSQIIPGVAEFVEQDVVPRMQAATKAPGAITGALARIFNPAGVSPESQATAGKLRANLGEMYHTEEQARSYLDGTRKWFTGQLVRRAPVDQYGPVTTHPAIQFVDAVENGKPLPPDMAEQQPFADFMRKQLDERWKAIQDAGIAEGFIDNYWPHVWEKPGRVQSFIGGLMGRRPFAGPESFKFQRKIPTFTEGLSKGLTPVSFNPVEQFALKLHEMNRSLVAHNTFEYLKDQNIATFVKGPQSLPTSMPPEGMEWVNDKIARAIEFRPTTKKSGDAGANEMVWHGQWALPKPAADILNNYLSPGLSGSKVGAITDAMRGLGNTLNQAQLGVSAFHLSFVGFDAAVSHTSAGIEALSQGRVKSGLKNLAQGLSGYAAPKSLVRGHQIAKAFRNPGLDPTSPMGRTVDLLERANARINMAPEYSNQAVASVRRAAESHNYIGAAFRLVPAAFEVAAKPVMEFAVPRLKLGVAEMMLKNEMERLGPHASEADITAAAQSVWDSVDNRMGQLVYDNLFWSNYIKEGGQLVQRSLGWNLGSVRELGGGVKDTLTTPWRMKAGGPAMTRRMNYAVALPLQVALYGSILHYLYNGKAPESLDDMMEPKVDGEPWQIASYWRDVHPIIHASREGLPGITHEIGKRTQAKLNPSISTIMEFMTNKDYWGNPIYGDSEDAQGVASWLLNQATPFSLRDLPAGMESSKRAKARQFFGFTKVPIQRTLAEEELAKAKGDIGRATKRVNEQGGGD